MLRALIVLTSHSQMGDTDNKTGLWLSELTHPYFVFTERGVAVDIVSIQGGEVPVDPKSREQEDELNARFLDNPALLDNLKHSKSLDDVQPEDYQAIVFAGGHGTMWDFPHDPDVQDKAAAIYEQEGVVASICHGSAALLNIRLSNDRLLIDDMRVTGFSNAEENAIGLTDIVPFSLQDELMIAGAHFVELPAWSANVVVDNQLVTGQNPQSATGVAEAVCDLLLM